MIGECCRRGNNGELLTIDHFLYCVAAHYGRSEPVSFTERRVAQGVCISGDRSILDARWRTTDGGILMSAKPQANFNKGLDPHQQVY
jgi:hypothetical protein